MRIKVTKVERAEKGTAKVTLLVAEREVEAFLANFGGWLEVSVTPVTVVPFTIVESKPPKNPDEGCMTCQKCFKCNCGRPECSTLEDRGACTCKKTLRANKPKPEPKPEPANEDMRLLERAVHHCGQSGLGIRLRLGAAYGYQLATWRTVNRLPEEHREPIRKLVEELDKAEAEASIAEAT